MKQNGNVLRHASEELKGDREVVLEAVKQHSDTLYLLFLELGRDREGDSHIYIYIYIERERERERLRERERER